MIFNYILRSSLKVTNLQNHKIIHHLIYVDDIKVFAKN